LLRRCTIADLERFNAAVLQEFGDKAMTQSGDTLQSVIW
jgi:hypothetical protein